MGVLLRCFSAHFQPTASCLADLGDGRRYWPVKEKFSSGWRPSSNAVKSSGASIETSAYVILTYLKADDVITPAVGGTDQVGRGWMGIGEGDCLMSR